MKPQVITSYILSVFLLLVISLGVVLISAQAQATELDYQALSSDPTPTLPPRLEPTPSPTPTMDLLAKRELDDPQRQSKASRSSPPPNDDIDNAIPIGSLPYVHTMNTATATESADDPYMDCGTGTNSNTVWYRLESAVSSLIEVNTFSSNYDTVLAVFTGTRGSLDLVVCNDDAGGTYQSQVNFVAEIGQSYYLEVADFGSPGGGLLSLAVRTDPSGAVNARELESGDELIHGFTYHNDYLWASTRTNPARILKIDPDTFDYQRIILPSGLNDGEDIIAAEGYIWTILYTNPARIIKINPESLEWEIAIAFGSGELSYGGSLEYAFGYLWAGGRNRAIARIDLSSLAYQVYYFSELPSDSQFHALTSGGGYIWASAPHYSWWSGWYADTVVRIDPTDPSSYSTVYISTPMADDIVYSDGYLYTGSEGEVDPFVYKIADDLTYDNSYSYDQGSYGTFSANGRIWSAHIGRPGRIVEFNTSLNTRTEHLLPVGYNNANEMVEDPDGNIYVTAWESPAKIVKYSALSGSVSCSVPFYSQRFPPPEGVADHPLRTVTNPNSQYYANRCSPDFDTIGKGGCTLTSATMVFDYYGADLTPPELSDGMGEMACPFYWAVGAASSGGKATYIDRYKFEWDRLESEINQNSRPVILGMCKRGTCDTGKRITHWVAVIGGQGNDPANYVMHDPWFENGAGMVLSDREDDYEFYQIAIYDGQPICDTGLRSSGYSSIAAETSDEPTTNNPVSMTSNGPNVSIYRIAGNTMFVHFTPREELGSVIEMQVWTDSVGSSTWRPLSSFLTVPTSDFVFVRYRDELGNETMVYWDTIHPIGPPDAPRFSYLPLTIR